MMNLLKWLSPRAPEIAPEMDAVPPLEGRSLSFDDVCLAFFPGLVNVAQPRVGDVLIVARSCGMGVSIQSERRVRVTGEPFSKNVYNGSRGGGDYTFVPTDGGDYPLQDVRRMNVNRRFWILIK